MKRMRAIVVQGGLSIGWGAIMRLLLSIVYAKEITNLFGEAQKFNGL